LMAKAQFSGQHRPLSKVDELRDRLAELEAKVGRLGHGVGPDEALTIPTLFDEINATLTSMQTEGQSLPAEEARLQAVAADLERKLPVFLRSVGGAGVLREARRAQQIGSEHWWWYIDHLLVERRRGRLVRVLRWGTIGVVVLGVLLVAFQLFLAPDPATRERIRRQQAAETLAEQGDWAGALQEVEQGLAAAPDHRDLLILKGVLQEQLGQGDAARETFVAAEDVTGSREEFLIERGQIYFAMVGQTEAALADIEAAIALNPESARAYLLLGGITEALGDYPRAIEAYQRAADLAKAQDDPEIAVVARYNLGLLLQSLPIKQSEEN
jgi:tetratricopeptide (TPR) repeat protein